MRFELVKVVEGEVTTYEGKTAKTGDIVEFSGQYAAKALKNPDYKLVGDEESTDPKPKRKYTRKVNSGDEG